MLAPYRPVLDAEHAWLIIVSGCVGRIGVVGLGLAIVLAVAEAARSFGSAGLCAGVMAAAAALSNVIQGRLMDRLSRRKVMATVAVAQVASAGLLAAALSAGSTAVLVACSLLVGLTMPAVGPLMRSLWFSALPDPRLRMATAATESVLTSVGFVLGPPVAAVLLALLWPAVALMAVSSLAAGGVVLAILSAAARHMPGRHAEMSRSEPLTRIIWMPFTVALALGIGEGFVNVAVPASTVDSGAMTVGAVLGLWSVGSIVGGVWYGAHAWSVSPERRLRICVLCSTVSLGLLALASSPAAFAAALMALGLSSGPTLTTAYVLISEQVKGRLTEAFGWISAALSVGVSAGSALAGAIFSSFGGAPTFLAACAVSFAALMTIIAGSRCSARRAIA
jgi:MFS family permease